MGTISGDFGLIGWAIVSILLLIFPIIALIDALKSQFENNYKLVWVMVIIFVLLIGPILYFTIGRKQKIKQ